VFCSSYQLAFGIGNHSKLLLLLLHQILNCIGATLQTLLHIVAIASHPNEQWRFGSRGRETISKPIDEHLSDLLSLPSNLIMDQVICMSISTIVEILEKVHLDACLEVFR
jgi:hypothetical protein